MVYGYSITIDPNGKPVIREFGNLKPSKLGPLKPEVQREPLVEVVSGDKVIQVIAELPGVDKSDIILKATEDTLAISVDSEGRKYHKEVDLPSKVDPNSAKANYKNGVLEVTLDKLGGKNTSDKQIHID